MGVCARPIKSGSAAHKVLWPLGAQRDCAPYQVGGGGSQVHRDCRGAHQVGVTRLADDNDDRESPRWKTSVAYGRRNGSAEGCKKETSRLRIEGKLEVGAKPLGPFGWGLGCPLRSCPHLIGFNKKKNKAHFRFGLVSRWFKLLRLRRIRGPFGGGPRAPRPWLLEGARGGWLTASLQGSL